MNRYTKRGNNGNVYATGPALVCWNDTPIEERMFCTSCRGQKDNRDVKRYNCGPLSIIDRLAEYEDTGLTPDEINLLLNGKNDPLTFDELRKMNGEPIFVQHGDGDQGYVVVEVDSSGISFYGPIYGEIAHCAEESVMNMTTNGRCGHYGLHVLGWRAYRRNPAEMW